MLDDLRRRFEQEVDRVGVTRIATALSISRSTVYNWIASGNAPLDKLAALQELGFDVVFVVTGDRETQALSQDEVELLEAFRAAPLIVKMAAIGALQGGMKKTAEKKQKQVVKGTANQVAGGDITNSQGVSFNGPTGKRKR